MTAAQLMKTSGFESVGGGANEWQETPEVIALRAKTGLRILMAVITSLFFLFIVSFLIRSQIADWEHLSAPWKPLANPWPLWINTGALVLASIFLQWSRISSRKQEARRTVETLVLAGFFSLVFIGGQLAVWQQLMSLGYFVSTNPANSFFYLLTGLHGLHLAGGLMAWCKTVVKAWRGMPIKQLSSSIELCAMYWHYLLGLWFVLLGLLTSSPETYAALVRLCGL
ncbi:cytochrome c oxidase subunit 3 [Oceanicoccus sp.]|uniref:cytochrome c oxidase subunit 3 n=2 Tax=Oceanicoccus sp. TaxID=2691044 RepID=UPI00260F62A1|nr:cytochrome c oxidase subunit 3 [Oceanicoccus sp.]